MTTRAAPKGLVGDALPLQENAPVQDAPQSEREQSERSKPQVQAEGRFVRISATADGGAAPVGTTSPQSTYGREPIPLNLQYKPFVVSRPFYTPSGYNLTEEAEENLTEIKTQAVEQCKHFFTWIRLGDSWHLKDPYQCPEGSMSVVESNMYTLPLTEVPAPDDESPPDYRSTNLDGRTKVFTFEPTSHTLTVAHLMNIDSKVEDALHAAQSELVEELGRECFTAVMITSVKPGKCVMVVSGSCHEDRIVTFRPKEPE